MAVFGLAAVLALFFLYEYSRIRRFDGGRGEALAFVSLMIVAFAFASTILFDVALPSPTGLIDSLLGAIGHMIIPRSG